jgi:site-specific DNA-cytosine methylase
VGAIFEDVRELGGDTAVNQLSGKLVTIPVANIIYAGFVCKSVSNENCRRAQHGDCVVRGVSATGETWSGVLAFVTRHRPGLVCLRGLCHSIAGRRSQIEVVCEALRSIGYSVGWSIENTEHHFLPQRRHRVWGWAFRGDLLGHRQLDVQSGPMQVLSTLRSLQPFPVDAVLG